MRQSRRGSCRHSIQHERSLASMLLAARPLITCGTTTFRRSVGSASDYPCLKSTPTTSFCAADRAELLPDKRPPYDRSTPLPAATDAGWGVGVDRDDTRDWWCSECLSIPIMANVFRESRQRCTTLGLGLDSGQRTYDPPPSRVMPGKSHVRRHREAPCYTFAMALVASPLGAVLVCGAVRRAVRVPSIV
jgi:hypothetical protein